MKSHLGRQKGAVAMSYAPQGRVWVRYRRGCACQPLTPSTGTSGPTPGDRSVLSRFEHPSRTEMGASQPNPSRNRWHSDHCAKFVSRIRHWEWLTRHVEA